jgi:Uma2 family endonuclease
MSTAPSNSTQAAIPALVPVLLPPILPPSEWSLADVQNRVGNIPPQRVRAFPAPGTATLQEVIDLDNRFNRHFELIDGILVEKTMGYVESFLAARIIRILSDFVEKHDLGAITGEGGTLRILPDQVRIPDVCFVSWQRFPGGCLSTEPVPAVVPDLAIEVLSSSNTPAEMERKLRDYFSAGVRLVWYIDPTTRSAKAYTAPDQCREVAEIGTLSGGDVLPGFELSLKELFARIEGPN